MAAMAGAGRAAAWRWSRISEGRLKALKGGCAGLCRTGPGWAGVARGAGGGRERGGGYGVVARRRRQEGEGWGGRKYEALGEGWEKFPKLCSFRPLKRFLYQGWAGREIEAGVGRRGEGGGGARRGARTSLATRKRAPLQFVNEALYAGCVGGLSACACNKGGSVCGPRRDAYLLCCSTADPPFFAGRTQTQPCCTHSSPPVRAVPAVAAYGTDCQSTRPRTIKSGGFSNPHYSWPEVT